MNFKHTFFLSAAVLLVSASGTFAQVKKKPTPSPKSKPVSPAQQIAPQASASTSAAQTLPVDPQLVKGTLPNGFTYYIRSTKAVPKVADLLLINKAGSIQETDAQRGYAHLISHLALKGTTNFSKSDLSAFTKNYKIIIKPDTNVMTGYDETVYRLTIPGDTADVLNKSLNLLAGWAGNVNFDAADVNDVKNAALAELKAASSLMKTRLDNAALPVLLNKSRYAQRNPKGEEATIAAADASALKSFYTDWYRPDLQAIVIVGDVDAKKIEGMIKTIFGNLKSPANPKPIIAYPIAPVAGTTVQFATDKDLPYVVTQVIIKHPQAVVKTTANYMENVKLNLFNEMLTQRFEELKQQSNSPFMFAQAGYSSFISKQDAFVAMAVADPRGVERATKTLAEEIERIRKFGFVATELERAKQNGLAQIAYEYEQRDRILPGNIATDYQRNFLSGNAVTGTSFKYNFYLDNIGKIDLAAMNALAAKLLTDQNRVILIQAPEAEKAQLPTEQALRSWFTGAGANLSAYEDNASNPLMEKLPTPGKVTSITTDSTLMVTNVVLSNGVKVLLKPTQFQQGQIILNGFAFGGSSLASDQDYVSADLAAKVISMSGVAGFSQTQLEGILRNKGVNVAPYINDVTHGFAGFSSAADFGEAIQLMHLYFTQPRKDAAAWDRLISQTKGSLVLRGADEISIFQDTVAALLSNYNKRGMTTIIPQLNTASLDRAYQFYKDRFSNAANFTFTFTGSFTVEAILPFLETYLGSLPTKPGTETFKDLGVHPVSGVVNKTITKGRNDKAISQLIFSGTYDYNDANNIDLDAIETVLYLKVAQRLNDTTGNSQVSVRSNYSKIPSSRYKVTIDIECPVADLDKVTNVVMDEINKFKQTGALQKELNTFILEEAKSTQSQMRQNAFWSSAMNVTAQNGDNPHKVLLRAQMLQQLTIARTKEAASKFLNPANLIKVTLLPEKK
ncbi:M16 family metallopeptidase [Mucilaginibacter auburnensis]|uniref:Zinc protease n=1 Tax=Mucilaginibacter auburnensis TaxID=1457233 RepID=A0A2H9VPP1_9SPHI|nr:pitrilysin family protein [Mucilaginibacter auburnensis]PJJ80304.1 zinc protease [Mucilaginibacter auburnensis]